MVLAFALVSCGDDNSDASDDVTTSGGDPRPSTGVASSSTSGSGSTSDSGSTSGSSSGDRPLTTTLGPETSTGPILPGEFDVYCFGTLVDFVAGIKFDRNDLGQSTKEVVELPHRVSLGVVDGDTRYLVVTGPDGIGGAVSYPVNVGLDQLALAPVIEFPIDAPNLFRGGAVSPAGVLLTSPSTDPFFCAGGDLSQCQIPATPEIISDAACSDDGSCVGRAPTRGTLVSSDGGASWTKLDDGYDPAPIAAGPDGVYVVADSFNQTVRTSTDGGQTWIGVTTPRGVDNLIPLTYAFDRFIGGQFAFGSTGIFVSPDGQTWTESVPAIPAPVQIMSPFQGGVVARQDASLQYVTFDGDNWAAIDIAVSYSICN